MDNIYIVVMVAVIFLVGHLFAIEKYHKQSRKMKKVILRDILGSPLHMLFVVGDSCFFIGLFYYLKDITKEESLTLMLIGFSIILIGTILYRWLHIWFEKDYSEDEKGQRKREF